MNLNRFLPVVVLSLGVALLSGAREQHSMRPRAPMGVFPKVVDGVAGEDLVIPDEERKVAGMSDYVLRAFGPQVNPDFTIYVGYYERQVQGQSIHSPKNCLPGAGWEILQSTRESITEPHVSGSVNRVLLANKGARALVFYWYQGRGRVEANEYTVKWNLLRDAALFGRTEEALVRIVFPVGESSDDVRRAEARAKQLVPFVISQTDQLLPTPVRAGDA
jgi:EpsI family protein